MTIAILGQGNMGAGLARRLAGKADLVLGARAPKSGELSYADAVAKADIVVLALPFDERSRVLRTAASQIGHYVYIVQEGRGFQAWLRKPGILSIYQLARLRDPAPEGTAALIRRLPGARDTAPIPALRGPDAPAP